MCADGHAARLGCVSGPPPRRLTDRPTDRPLASVPPPRRVPPRPAPSRPTRPAALPSVTVDGRRRYHQPPRRDCTLPSRRVPHSTPCIRDVGGGRSCSCGASISSVFSRNVLPRQDGGGSGGGRRGSGGGGGGGSGGPTDGGVAPPAAKERLLAKETGPVCSTQRIASGMWGGGRPGRRHQGGRCR